MSQVKQRRICWPDPDATCLEGGCLYCSDAPWRDVATVERWAARTASVRNRGDGAVRDPLDALEYGRAHAWGNAPSRTRAVTTRRRRT